MARLEIAQRQAAFGKTWECPVTFQNLRVLQVREEDGVILVSGAVPGANGSNVIVRPAKKKPAKAAKK
jgi:ribosomal protein L3